MQHGGGTQTRRTEGPQMASVLPDVHTARGVARCIPSASDPSLLSLKYSRSKSIKQIFVSIFLPTGYPASVSSDYRRYYTWQFIQGLCSTITGMLSSKATLEGLGVGTKGAAAATATLFLALKDAVGRIASIAFAWWQGSQLDCNAKRWRLTADVAHDIGVWLELLAPLAAMYTTWWVFVLLISLANVGRAVSGVAGGATRVSMVQHFALKDNIADIAAKGGSQEILCGLLGMILGMLVTTLVDKRDLWASLAALLFTALLIIKYSSIILDVFGNWRSLKLVVLKTVNRQRGHLLFSAYFASNTILTPKEVSTREGIWTRVWSDNGFAIGVTPDVATRSTANLVHTLSQFNGEKYALTLTNSGKIVVLLREGATALDQVRSLFQAEYIHYRRATTDADQLVAESLRVTRNSFPAVAAKLTEAGWNLSTPHLAAGEARLIDKSNQ